MVAKNEQALISDASKAAKIILEYVEEESVIHITSHLDADGLAASGIMGKALIRLGAFFCIRIERWIDDRVVKELKKRKAPLIIFTDLGSGYLDLLGESLAESPVIILDHHQPVGELPPTFIQVNPHLHGIDGSIDLSGAGVAYFVAKSIDEKNKDLSYLAVVGALGDIQDKYEHRGLGGTNEKIVQDAVDAGFLEVENDIILYGRETRPIHRALAYTMNPIIPGISGEEDKSLAFLNSLKIKPKEDDTWRTLRDLSEKEKKIFFSAIADYLVSNGLSSDIALNLIGRIYTLTKEEARTPLKNAREFASLLNATGRMAKPSLGVALCMGARGDTLEQAKSVLGGNRREISRCLNWIEEKPRKIQELNNIYILRGETFIDEKIISTIASMISTSLPNPEKPLVASSKVEEEHVYKISARASPHLVNTDLNLGEILRVAAEKVSGRGGGHNIAAGAQVPIGQLEDFLIFVNKQVGIQTQNT